MEIVWSSDRGRPGSLVNSKFVVGYHVVFLNDIEAEFLTKNEKMGAIWSRVDKYDVTAWF